MTGTDRIIINIIYIWFSKKKPKINNTIWTRKQVNTKIRLGSFLESKSETRMLSILLLWTPSLKYCSKLKGDTVVKIQEVVPAHH